MGLKITSEIATGVGMTSEAYLNIDSVSYKKNKLAGDMVAGSSDSDIPLGLTGMSTDNLTVKVNLYLNVDDRLNLPMKRVISGSIPKEFGFFDHGSPSPISELKGDSNMFEVAYSQIKAYLEDKGLTVIDY